MGSLWGAEDALKANSKPTAVEYKEPVLGLIFLRYAQNRYEEAKKQLEIAGGIFSNIHEKYNILYDELNKVATKLKDTAEYAKEANSLMKKILVGYE